MTRSERGLLLLVPALALACAHWQPNPRLQEVRPQEGYRFAALQAPGNSDSLFVVLSFSGGGTRAAALSYGLLEQLRRTSIVWKGETKPLLAEVDVISSVSGGSFTSLDYALRGEGTFADFESRFLKADIQGALARQVLLPWNWFRLASPTFDRSDLAAEHYDRFVFDGRSYGDLEAAAKRPFVIVNATDMTVGARFEFTQDQFDPLCSDLSGVPLARAAAASSAVPGLLSPLTLRSYAAERCGFAKPGWYESARLDPYEVNPRRFLDAERLDLYLAPEKRYVHLVDGGVSDNIGLRGPLHALVSLDSPWSLQRLIDLRRVEKVVVLAANAKTGGVPTFDRQENAPHLLSVLQSSAGAPMAHYSFETVERVRNERDLDEQLQRTVADCNELLRGCGAPPVPGELQPVDFYVVEVGFDALADAGQRAFFKGLPTSFRLPAVTVDCLRSVAGRVLVEAGDYQRLLDDLEAAARAAGVAPPTRAPAPAVPAACGASGPG